MWQNAGAMWRDAKRCTIGAGPSEIQRLIIARQILRVSKDG